MAEQQNMKLPFSHRWKNTSTCGRGLTEYLLNTGRIPQTAERVRKSPGNQIGKKIKKKMRTELGWDLHPWEGAVEEERFLHPGKPLYQRDLPGQKGSFRASKENAAARVEGKLSRWSRWQPETQVCQCGQGRCQNSGFRDQTWRED